jgi:hypothetical protein
LLKKKGVAVLFILPVSVALNRGAAFFDKRRRYWGKCRLIAWKPSRVCGNTGGIAVMIIAQSRSYPSAVLLS